VKAASFCLAEKDFWQLGTSFFNPPWFCCASHQIHPTFVASQQLLLVSCCCFLLFVVASCVSFVIACCCSAASLLLVETTRKGLHCPAG
jgi:hypothetical protein